MTDLAAIEACGAFGRPSQCHYWWERVYQGDEWLAELGTHSRHRGLPAGTRDQLLAEIGEVIDHHGGELVVRMRTDLLRSARPEQPGNRSR